MSSDEGSNIDRAFVRDFAEQFGKQEISRAEFKGQYEQVPTYIGIDFALTTRDRCVIALVSVDLLQVTIDLIKDLQSAKPEYATLSNSVIGLLNETIEQSS